VLRLAREAIVRRHAGAECRHDVEATLAAFHSARYEVASLGVSEGDAAVRDLLSGMITGLPDWNLETGPFCHGNDFVFVKAQMTATHDGPWAGWEAGRRMDVTVACVFGFEEDRLICEKVYFDMATVKGQLGNVSISRRKGEHISDSVGTSATQKEGPP